MKNTRGPGWRPNIAQIDRARLRPNASLPHTYMQWARCVGGFLHHHKGLRGAPVSEKVLLHVAIVDVHPELVAKLGDTALVKGHDLRSARGRRVRGMPFGTEVVVPDLGALQAGLQPEARPAPRGSAYQLGPPSPPRALAALTPPQQSIHSLHSFL